MIRQDDLAPGSYTRARKLWILIREEKVTFAGNERLKIYGTLKCSSGKKMKVSNRVFFATAGEAESLGYRPCGHCLKAAYHEWKTNRMDQSTTPVNLLPYDGHAFLYNGFFTKEESAGYLQELQRHIAWKQEAIQLFGKTVMQPRLTAWYGDDNKTYSYSGITMHPLPWTKALLEIRERIERQSGHLFNSALLNLYRDGNDSMGWHRDNEKELGSCPVIASVSFGASRMFRFRNYKDKKIVIDIPLHSGSLLLMSGTTQTHWQHQLPKTKAATGVRINITFRCIIS